MYVDMRCGGCEANFMLDSDENNSGVWLLVHRFANAHSSCGYMTPPASAEIESVKTTSVTASAAAGRRRIVKKSRSVDEDEQ